MSDLGLGVAITCLYKYFQCGNLSGSCLWAMLKGPELCHK